MFASIDIETTGTAPGYHEIIQVAVLPLTSDFQFAGTPFYTNLKPEYPERSDIAASRTHGISLEELRLHAPDSDKVMELLIEWQEKLGYRPVPISHNWPFERGFLLAWLGDDLLGDLFDVRARDTMAIAAAMNDRAVLNAEEPPFERLTLTRLCRKLKVNNDNPHDALSDAIACSEVYKRMLQLQW